MHRIDCYLATLHWKVIGMEMLDVFNVLASTSLDGGLMAQSAVELP